MRVRIRHSKSDQEGVDVTISIVRDSVACPVQALRSWLTAAGITEGLLFRAVAKGGRLGSARFPKRRPLRADRERRS